MLDDLADFVRQGALMATAMVLMQCSETHKSYKKFNGKVRAENLRISAFWIPTIPSPKRFVHTQRRRC